MARWTQFALRLGIQRPMRAQRGQAMIMMAIMLPMLVVFMGLVADSGLAYVTKARLQNTVDAAALAGAHQLPAPSEATTLACTYVDSNSVQGMTGSNCSSKATVTFEQSNTVIKVESTRRVPTVFGSLLGKSFTDVTARAKVKIGSPGTACIFPFFLNMSEVTSVNQFAPIGIQRGSAIDVGSGANAVRDAMPVRQCDTPTTVNGRVDLLTDDDVDLKPGASSQFKDGWVKRFEHVSSSSCPQGNVNTYLTEVLAGSLNQLNCPRLVLMPVLPDPPSGTDYKGNEKNVPIQGFASFWVREFCLNSNCPAGSLGSGSPALKMGDVWGYFVPLNVSSSTYMTYNPAFGSKVMVMAE